MNVFGGLILTLNPLSHFAVCPKVSGSSASAVGEPGEAGFDGCCRRGLVAAALRRRRWWGRLASGECQDDLTMASLGLIASIPSTDCGVPQH